ncbi:MAG TPA: hypothetical protein PLW67_02505, partial [Prolixibacteraceae bacterium]|nr:hypothetical protein [Prolixibacteraceae bacterium]
QDSIKLAIEAEKLKKAQELAEAKAKAEAEAKAKAEAEAKAKAEAEAEKARLAALQKARQDSIKLAIEAEKLKKAQELAEAKAKAEAEAKAKAEALAQAKAKAEAEAKVKAEAEAKAKAEAEAEKARLAALQKARQDSIKMAIEAEKLRQAQLLAEAKAKAEAEAKARAEAQAKAKAEAEAKAKEELEKARLARLQALTNENQELYNSLIANADQSFSRKEYNVSRAWYFKALALLPEEKYPKEKIDEINTIIHSLRLSEAELEYQQNIDKGDEAFRNNQWAVSRSWYNKALGLKQNDAYSRSQLSEIQLKVNEQASGNSLLTFNNYMEQGKKAFDLKQYNIARVWYLRAKEIKPTDPNVNGKLEELRKVTANP